MFYANFEFMQSLFLFWDIKQKYMWILVGVLIHPSLGGWIQTPINENNSRYIKTENKILFCLILLKEGKM